jgi:hypothetical protein
LWKENRSGMQMNGLFGEATMIFLPAIDKYCILPLKTKKEWYIAWFTIYSCSYMKWIKQYWVGRLKKNPLANDQANIAWFTKYSWSCMKWIKQYWLGRLQVDFFLNDQPNIAWFTIYSCSYVKLGEIFFSWNRSYRVSKNREFYADFKNANLSYWQNAPKKSWHSKTVF